MKELITMIINAKDALILGVKASFEVSKVLGSIVISCPIVGLLILFNWANKKKC